MNSLLLCILAPKTHSCVFGAIIALYPNIVNRVFYNFKKNSYFLNGFIFLVDVPRFLGKAAKSVCVSTQLIAPTTIPATNRTGAYASAIALDKTTEAATSCPRLCASAPQTQNT